MSIFKTQTKKMKTKITGEELELNINNAVWILMKDKYGLSQSAFDDEYQKEGCVVGSKFICAVFESNGILTTPEDVLKHTVYADILSFMMSYNMATFRTDEHKVEEEEVGESQR